MDEETKRAINEALNIVQQSQQEGASLRHPVETPAMEQQQPEDHIPPSEPASSTPSEQEGAESQPQAQHKRHRFLWVGGVMLLVSISMLVFLLIPPLVQPVATITLIPAVKTVTGMSSITVQGRALASFTLTQARTEQTTGTGEQEAREARGTITFYNALPAAQTVPAGTLLTGGDGIEVVTEQDAVIPAGNLATNGRASVAAHSVQRGPQGNIAAGDIYGACCRANVFVSNGPFTGGQNAKRYPMVTQSDLDHASTTLQASMSHSINATFQAQVQPGEAAVPPTCQMKTVTDHRVGEEATQVNMTVTATCQDMAYQTQATEAQVTHDLKAQARAELGDGYAMTGDPHITVMQSRSQGTTLTLQAKGQASFAYQFQGRLQVLKQQIAGKSKQDAIAFLTQQPGVSAVSLDISTPLGTSTATIPQDVNAIHITVLYSSPS
jgi:hypothetical protein